MALDALVSKEVLGGQLRLLCTFVSPLASGKAIVGLAEMASLENWDGNDEQQQQLTRIKAWITV